MRNIENYLTKYTKGSIIQLGSIKYAIIETVKMGDKEIKCLPVITSQDNMIKINSSICTIPNDEYYILPIHIHEARLNLVIQNCIESSENVNKKVLKIK